jgi:hypothetical protein
MVKEASNREVSSGVDLHLQAGMEEVAGVSSEGLRVVEWDNERE